MRDTSSIGKACGTGRQKSCDYEQINKGLQRWKLQASSGNIPRGHFYTKPMKRCISAKQKGGGNRGCRRSRDEK
jgi:hypothetical protein